MDYARDYWNGAYPQSKPDPFCCRSCRRDTNRDAADAPGWVGTTESDPYPIASPVVFTVPKTCQCGHQWLGKAFQPLPAGLTALAGVCPSCLAAEARAIAELMHPVREVSFAVPVLERPARVADD